MTALHLQQPETVRGEIAVLAPLSLDIQPGEKVALVGRSGAGKTTLLELLYASAGQDCALLPQEPGLVEALSVFHNVYMGALARHRSWYNLLNLAKPLRSQVTAMRPLLEELGLAEKLFTPVAQLSGGQKQRTAVARALYQKAPVLLADEPVSALDQPRACQVMQLLTQRHETALIALHDVTLALGYCSRVIGLRDGELALDEPANRLATQDLLAIY